MKKINNSYLFAISMVSAPGGLLFGYDWVVKHSLELGESAKIKALL